MVDCSPEKPHREDRGDKKTSVLISVVYVGLLSLHHPARAQVEPRASNQGLIQFFQVAV